MITSGVPPEVLLEIPSKMLSGILSRISLGTSKTLAGFPSGYPPRTVSRILGFWKSGIPRDPSGIPREVHSEILPNILNRNPPGVHYEIAPKAP